MSHYAGEFLDPLPECVPYIRPSSWLPIFSLQHNGMDGFPKSIKFSAEKTGQKSPDSGPVCGHCHTPFLFLSQHTPKIKL